MKFDVSVATTTDISSMSTLVEKPRPTQVNDLVARLERCDHNSSEGKALLALAEKMIRIFDRDSSPHYLPEVVELARISQLQNEILTLFANKIIAGTTDNTILRDDQLVGFLTTLQLARGTLSSTSAPLGPVLTSVQKRLTAAIESSGNDTQEQLRLVCALSKILDILVDLKVYGLDRVTIHEALLKQLKALCDRSELRLVQAAEYAHEALVAIPNNETSSQEFLRYLWGVGEGVAEVAGAIPTVDAGRLFKAIPNLLQVPELMKSAFKLVKGIHPELRRPPSWYLALRYASLMIQSAALNNLIDFLALNPYRKEQSFLCGLYAELEKARELHLSHRDQVMKVIEETLSQIHPSHRQAQTWVHVLADVFDRPDWQTRVPIKRHGLRKWRNTKYTSNLSFLLTVGVEPPEPRGGLLETSWRDCDETQKFYADVQLREYYSTNKLLDIKRLSGDLLDMEQCYINLSIINYDPHNADGQNQGEDEKSSFSLFSRLKVAASSLEKEVKLDNIFDEREGNNRAKVQPRRILIRGRAGVGKTTLCKKIVHDFLHQKMWSKYFNRVIWIPLRQLKGSSTIDAYFRQTYFSRQGDRDILVSALQRMAFDPSNATLWILDGLDEVLTQRDSSGGPALTAVLKDLLNQVNVIITSRPYAVDLHEIPPFDLQLETVGFHPNQVQAYISKAISQPHVAKEVREFIQSHWLIQGLTRIPIQLDALCFSWDEKFIMSNESQTMSALYQAIELKLWNKDISDLKPEIGIGRLRTREQVKSHISTVVAFLEFLAFTGLQNNVLEFSQTYLDDLYKRPEFCGLSDRDLDRVSFLRTSGISPREKSYYFLHLTFQEFFAAQYISKCWVSQDENQFASSNPEQLSRARKFSPKQFLQQEKYNSRYDILWRFVAGLLHDYDKSHDENQLLKFFQTIEEEPHDLIGPAHVRLLMHCFSEIPEYNLLHGGDNSLCKLYTEMETGCLQWSLFESQFLTMMRLCSETEFPERVIKNMLQGEIMQDKNRRRALFGGLHNRWQCSLEVLHILTDYLGDDDYEYFNACLILIMQLSLPLPILEALVAQLEDSDPANRQAAIRALSGQSPLTQPILEALVAQLGDSNPATRQAAIEVLGEQSSLPQPILEALIAQLEDSDPAPRRAAIIALGKQPSLPLPTLEALMAQPKDSDFLTRQAAIQALGEQSSLPLPILEALIAQLEDSDPTPRRTAIDVLRRQSSLPLAALEALIAQLEDSGPATRQAAIEVLHRQLTLPLPALEALVAQLKDSDFLTRWAAIQALGEQSPLPLPILEALVAQLEDSNPATRQAAIEVLGEQSSLPQPILEALIAQLDDSDPVTRRAAIRALSGQSPLTQPILEALVAQLEDSDPATRQAAIEVLGEQSPLTQPILEALIAQLEDSDPVTRRVAIQALSGQSPLTQPILEALLLRMEDRDPATRRVAIQALSWQSPLPQQILEALIAQVEDSDPATRQAAIEVLGKQPSLPLPTLEALAAQLKDSEISTRQAAINALCTQPSLPLSILEALVAQVEDSDPATRRATIEVLGEQSSLPQPILEALVAQLEDSDPATRQAAIEALSRQSSLAQDTINILTQKFKHLQNDMLYPLEVILWKQDRLRCLPQILDPMTVSTLCEIWIKRGLEETFACYFSAQSLCIEASDSKIQIFLDPEKADLLRKEFQRINQHVLSLKSD